MQKYLFLDRDGVINVDTGYVYQKFKIEYIPGVFKLISNAIFHDFKIAIVTNQSGIGRGYFTEQQFHELMRAMTNEMVNYSNIMNHNDLIYLFCPHLPTDNCDCRKPGTGLFEACEKQYNFPIDWQNSIMVGDRITDMIAAEKMGIQNTYLLTTAAGLRSDQKLNYVGSFRQITSLSDVEFPFLEPCK